MKNSIEVTESFLHAYHLENPSCTPQAFVPGKTKDGATSYDVLITMIGGAEGRILDLACGDGFLLSRMVAWGREPEQLFGLDMSDGELKVARERTDLSAAQLTSGNARALPYVADSFSAVTCHMALMLMPQVDDVLFEIHRVLEPGGIFCAVVGGSSITGPSHPIFYEKLDELLKLEGKENLGGLGDDRLRTLDETKSLFSSCRFGSTSIEDIDFFFKGEPDQLADYFMLSYNPFLLSPASQATLRDSLIQKFDGLREPDGLVHHRRSLRFITSRNES